MSEILQAQSLVKLYDNDYTKEEIDDALIHYGVLGMKWGVRKDRLRQRRRENIEKSREHRRKVRKRVKRWNRSTSDRKYSTREEAIKAKDVTYINEHRNEFSTDELNRVMNRINTEQRLSQMAYDRTTYARVTRSKAFKAVAGAAISGLTFAAVNYVINQDKSQIPKNFAVGAVVGGVTNLVPSAKGDLNKLKKASGKK